MNREPFFHVTECPKEAEIVKIITDKGRKQLPKLTLTVSRQGEFFPGSAFFIKTIVFDILPVSFRAIGVIEVGGKKIQGELECDLANGMGFIF